MRSLECFQLAVERDPSYALAYAGIADVLITALNYSVIAPSVGLPKAREAVAKALELDEFLADAHAILGVIRVIYEWDAEAGEKEFQRAIELNPATIRTRSGTTGSSMIHQGRCGEAEARARQALEFDPLSTAHEHSVGCLSVIWQAIRGCSGTIAQNIGNGSEFP